MKRNGSPRRWRLLALTAGLALLAALSVPAEAMAAPDFTCGSPSVCVFDGSNFNGNETSFVPSLVGDQWLSLTMNGITLPWGSFNNNSGSCVIFYNASAAEAFYAEAHVRLDAAQLSAATLAGRYIYIEYGYPDCGDANVPSPP